MKKIFKVSALITAILSAAALAWAALVIHQASAYTRNVILEDHRAGQWRIYQGQPRALSPSDLSPSRIDQLLKIQDPGFYRHRGIDLTTPGVGLTTITQSITKKLYFKAFRPGLAKLRQSLIARFVTDKHLSKEAQLTIFLNCAYLGSPHGTPIYGFPHAARTYFQTDLSRLTSDQYLSLVAMLAAPDGFCPLRRPEKHRQRLTRVKAVISGQYQPKSLTDVYYDRP
ncbi:MAG: transglycosylase domain-containing protein, partial [Desulfobacterales bacterium]|nr:transglycosylase domain-containing protein [Desulfobacterales bacterium]